MASSRDSIDGCVRVDNREDFAVDSKQQHQQPTTQSSPYRAMPTTAYDLFTIVAETVVHIRTHLRKGTGATIGKKTKKAQPRNKMQERMDARARNVMLYGEDTVRATEELMDADGVFGEGTTDEADDGEDIEDDWEDRGDFDDDTIALSSEKEKSNSSSSSSRGRRLDKDKACADNDAAFAISRSLQAERREGHRSLSWLLANAEAVDIHKLCGSQIFKCCVLMEASDADIEKFRRAQVALASNPKTMHRNLSAWDLFLIGCGKVARAWLHNVIFDSMPQLDLVRPSVSHLVDVARELSILMYAQNSRSEKIEASGWSRADLGQSLSGDGASIPDTILICQWIILHTILRKLCTLVVPQFESSTKHLFQLSAWCETSSALRAKYHEPVKRGPKKKPPASPASPTAPNDAGGGDDDDKDQDGDVSMSGENDDGPPFDDTDEDRQDRFVNRVRVAVWHVMQMLDQLWFVPFIVVKTLRSHSTGLPENVTRRRSFGEFVGADRDEVKVVSVRQTICPEFQTRVRNALLGWRFMSDALNPTAIAPIRDIEGLFVTSSNSRRSNAPVLGVHMKATTQRSGCRLFESSYMDYIKFDPRYRLYAIEVTACSILGNMESSWPGDYANFTLRSMVYRTVCRVRDSEQVADHVHVVLPVAPRVSAAAAAAASAAETEENASSWQFWKTFLSNSPVFFFHALQQQMFWRLRASPTLDEYRRTLHQSASDADDFEDRVGELVTAFRRVYEAGRYLLFPGDVLRKDVVPQSVKDVAEVANELFSRRSQALRIAFNHGKRDVRFLAGLRARIRSVPVYHATLWTSCRDAFDTWFPPFADRRLDKIQDAADLVSEYVGFDFCEGPEGRHAIFPKFVPPVVHVAARLGITFAQFDVLSKFVLHHYDVFVPRPEHVMCLLLPLFGSPPEAVDAVREIIGQHHRAQPIESACRALSLDYPQTYALIQAFASLVECVEATVVHRMDKTALRAHAVICRDDPQCSYAMYCIVCDRIRSFVRDFSGRKQVAGLLRNKGYVNVKRSSWSIVLNHDDVTDSKRPYMPEPEEMPPPEATCNDSIVFGDTSCCEAGNLIKLPMIGRFISHRKSIYFMCSFPGCKTHCRFDATQCMYFFGAYICYTCTRIVMSVAALLREQYGVIGGDLTHEMPMVEMTLDHGYVRMMALIRSSALRGYLDSIGQSNQAGTDNVEMKDAGAAAAAAAPPPPSANVIAARARRSDLAVAHAAARLSGSVARIARGPGANKRKREHKQRK